MDNNEKQSLPGNPAGSGRPEGVFMVPVELEKLIAARQGSKNDDIDLAAVFAWLWGLRRKLLSGLVAGGVIAAIVSFLITTTWRAEVSYLPVEANASKGMAMFSQLGGLAGLAGLSGGPDFSGQLKVVLESTALAGRMFERFPELEPLLYPPGLLAGLFGSEPLLPEKRNFEFTELVSVTEPGRSGGPNVFSVELPDATMTAVIANAYMEELASWVNQNTLTTARRSREYLDTQVEQSRRELAEKEEALKAFQEKHRLVAVNIQTEEVIKLVASLKAQLVTLEMEREILLKTSTAADQRVRQIEDRIAALSERVANLETGADRLVGRLNAPDMTAAAADLMAGGLASAPQLLLDYYRLRREVEITQKVFELLVQQQALARVEEQHEGTSFTIVDPAVIPWEKAKPRRKLFALAGAFIGLLLVLAGAVVRDYARLLVPENKTNDQPS